MPRSGTDSTEDPLTYEITFRADAVFVEKLRRLQALLSTGDPNPPLALIFDRAIELALDHHDPERREARRRAGRARNAKGTDHRNPEWQAPCAEKHAPASTAEVSDGDEAGIVDHRARRRNPGRLQVVCLSRRCSGAVEWYDDARFRSGFATSFSGSPGADPAAARLVGYRPRRFWTASCCWMSSRGMRSPKRAKNSDWSASSAFHSSLETAKS